MPDTLWCEQCGEAEQEVHLAEAGLCGDCFRQAFQEEAGPMFSNKPCGHPYFSAGQLVGVCLIPAGTEHDHSCVRGWAEQSGGPILAIDGGTFEEAADYVRRNPDAFDPV